MLVVRSDRRQGYGRAQHLLLSVWSVTPEREAFDVIRIEISAVAYAALCEGVAPDSRLPALPSPAGGFYLWLDKMILAKFKAAREPGESYSDVILRMSCAELV